MLTDQQEKTLSNAQQRSAKRRQDKQFPHVVNVNDGRLMPNVLALRNHKDYRVYQGPKDASTDDRLRWLQGVSKTPKVTNSQAEADDFDVGKATKDDLIVFAMEQYGAPIDPAMDIRTMRKKIVEMAEKAAAQATPLPAEETSDLT